MSIVSCFCMILLLCLSKQEYSSKAQHIEDCYKGVSPVVEKVHLQMESGNQGGDSYDDHGDYKGRHFVTIQEYSKKGFSRGKFSGGVLRKKPLVYVPWRVHSKKQLENKKSHFKDKNPGFYSDYARPRTHPPSHN